MACSNRSTSHLRDGAPDVGLGCRTSDMSGNRTRVTKFLWLLPLSPVNASSLGNELRLQTNVDASSAYIF